MSLIVGILLAAGSSLRFGTDKLLQTLPEGDCVAVSACKSLLIGTDHVLAVVRPGITELEEQLYELGAEVMVFHDAAEGMGSSLGYAVRSSPDDTGGWLIALADMPWIKPSTIHKLSDCIRSGAEMAAPTYRGQRGHPVGFAKSYRPELSAIRGDSGAKSLLVDHHERLKLIEVDDWGVLRDIDRLEDLTA